jgi:hypothetical protein
MPVSSYPRVTVQGTGTPQNPQNGSALMVVNPSTGKYEAATAATFGGGGGDATAANQVITNDLLQLIIDIFKGKEPSLLSAGNSNINQNEGVQIGNKLSSVEDAGETNVGVISIIPIDAKIIGGTDNTIIGNTGNSLNVKTIV